MFFPDEKYGFVFIFIVMDVSDHYDQQQDVMLE